MEVVVFALFIRRILSKFPAPMSDKAPTLTINEIYESIQGESSWAGWRCVFVRLTFCDLRCTYCDTEYAFYEGKKRPVAEVVDEVLKFDAPLVEITGGEPLLQKNVLPLMTARCGSVLFSPIFGRIEPRQIVEWIIEDKLPVRFQLQMHKFIWDPKQKGV